MIEIHNIDNELFVKNIAWNYDFIYADCIYDIRRFDWLYPTIKLLKNNGILIIQTDYHTIANYKVFLDSVENLNFVNWLIYINDWGGTPKNRFAQKHDDILIYCNGNNWKWYPDRIQIPKATAGTRLDKKGTGLKTPPSVFYDKASFSTISNERVKFDNKNIQWQKPEWLMERLLLPFTDEGDDVLDIFMGSGTLGVVCKHHNRNYTGIELNKDIYKIAVERIQ